MPKAVSNTRGWWRDFFLDHPLFASKHASATSGGKTKVYCILCFNADIASLQNEYLHQNPPITKDRAQIETELWARERNETRGWLRSAPATLLGHLRNCAHQPASVRENAKQDHVMRGGASPTKRIRTRQTHPQTNLGVGLGFSDIPLSDFGANYVNLNEPDPEPPFVAGSSTSFDTSVWALSHGVHAHLPPPSSYSASPALSHASLPPLSCRATPVLSESSSGSIVRPPLSRSQSHRHLPANPGPLWASPNNWNSTRQERFETCITRLTVSANLPLSWVDNVNFTSLCNEFIPQAHIPSRKVLSGQLIPAAAAELRVQAKAIAKGHEVTVQADGWTGLNNHHLIAVMITVEGKVFTVRVHDASAERKTAVNLVALLESVLAELRNEWEVVVVAIVTDAAGESKLARNMLGRKYAWLVVIDCYAHQINLVVGDYFKSSSHVLKYTDDATELITWLRKKTLILALLRHAQVQANTEVVSVLRAVLTRWTAHFVAYTRLLQLRPSLTSLIYADEARPNNQQLVVTGDAKAKAKARLMVSIIKNEQFWIGLARMRRHLEPLAVAASVTQASFCHLDQVLLTFGFLVMQYQGMTDPNDLAGCQAIIKSIEKRWAAADQKLFIAAVILNPYFHTAPFAELPFLNNAGIHQLLHDLWRRFYQTDPTREFARQAEDYLRLTGTFSNLKSHCDLKKALAEQDNETPDPLDVYKDFSVPDRESPPFITLARRVLSICANSASCERLFSVFGATLTKLRSRLGTKLMTSISELKMHLRDEEIRQGSAKPRLKRQLGARVATASQPTPDTDIMSPPAAAPSAPSTTNPQPMPSVPPSTTQATADTPPDGLDNSASTLDFRAIIDQHIRLVTEDGDDEPSMGITDIGGPWTIAKLFDFSRTHWVDIFSRSPRRSFEEELKLYELLDAEEEGVENLDVDVDDATAELLFS